MKSLASLIGAAAALVGLAFGASAQDASQYAPKPLPQRETVRVALTSKVEPYVQILVADKLGEFDKENIDIEYTMAKSSDGIVLLSTERVDVLGGQVSAAVMNAIAAGADIRVVAPLFVQTEGSKQGIWINKEFLAGRPFTFDLFKGQKIGSAVGLGSMTTYFLQKEFDKVGITLRDISFQQMPSADILVALENGAIPFGFLIDSVWQKADESKVMSVFRQSDTISGGSWSFGPRLLNQRRDVGEAVMRALVRTTLTHLNGDYHADQKVMDVLVSEIGIPEETIRKGAALHFRPDFYIPLDLAAELQKAYAMVPDVLSYKDPMPDERVFDRSFLKAAGIPAPAN